MKGLPVPKNIRIKAFGYNELTDTAKKKADDALEDMNGKEAVKALFTESGRLIDPELLGE